MKHLLNQITQGDCLQVMREIPDNSIDLICTDPPYFLINNSGQGFMNRSWDGIIGLWKYLWANPIFVKDVENFLLSLRVEENMEEENIAPENVCTQKGLGSPVPARYAENLLRFKEASEKDFAPLLVLTKQEVLDLLKELSFIPIKTQELFLNGESENANFAIPISLLKRKLNNAVAESVLNSLTKATCGGKTIRLSLMDEVRINAVIEAKSGRILGKKFIEEIIGLAASAENIVEKKKFNVITLKDTKNPETMKWLTLLLFTINAMPEPKKIPYLLIKNFFTVVGKELIRTLKPGAFAFIMSSPRQDVLSRMILGLEEAGFKTGFTSLSWIYHSGFPKAANISKLVDKSPEAKKLDGAYAGFQPKPSLENIIVVMKPIEYKSYTEQAMKNRHGVTWLDDCRIPIGEETLSMLRPARNPDIDIKAPQTNRHDVPFEYRNSSGRFPANILVSDKALNDGTVSSGAAGWGGKSSIGYHGYGEGIPSQGEKDSGSTSRFYDLDAWFENLISPRIKELPESAQRTFPFLQCTKPGKKEKDRGCENLPVKQTTGGGGMNDPEAGRIYGSLKTKGHNPHPTCKPIKLMSWLITLGSRKGDTVLDPFCGSGTTCIAANMLERNYIGIEIDPESAEVARARIAGNSELFQEAKESTVNP